MSLIKRSHFFPGQLIDYQDFNRLSSQPDQVVGLVLRHLFQGGGIVHGSLGSFEILPLDGTSVRVRSGIGLLPNGQCVHLEKDEVVSLGNLTDGRTTYVFIRNKLVGCDPYQDQYDTSISGFRAQVFEAEILISKTPLGDDSLELFRVLGGPADVPIRVASAAEEWDEIVPPKVIDLRFRRVLVPQTYAPFPVDEQIHLRNSLYFIEQSLKKIEQVYCVQDTFNSLNYLIALHAELLTRPFQPLKAGYLSSEAAEKLAYFLEGVARAVGAQRTHLDRETIHRAIEKLERMKVKEVLPRTNSLEQWGDVANEFRQLVAYAENKFSLVRSIIEGFTDLKSVGTIFEDRLALAGHLLERVDLVNSDQETAFRVQTGQYFRRKVSAKYENGAEFSLKGTLLKEGSLTVDFKVVDLQKPVILLLRQYIRRGGYKVHYEINGKHLVSDSMDYVGEKNCWENRGLMIPTEFAVMKENQLRIRVERADLDFGFFEMGVYQPAIYQVSNELEGAITV